MGAQRPKTMSDQDKMKLDPALLAESINTLTKQLALLEKEPMIHIAQALVVIRTELSKTNEEVAATKHML